MMVTATPASSSSSLRRNIHAHLSAKDSYPTTQNLNVILHRTVHISTNTCCRFRAPPSSSNSNGVLSIRAYMEKSNSLSGFANKVIGSLPVVGLIARIVNDEGGVGGDAIDFAEFRRRVGKKCTITDSRAFYEFQDRHGKSGDPLHVLLCCWLAAVGAGLLKSEEILEGVARLRLSGDLEFEEQNFIAKMNEAKERRAKLRGVAPMIPMEIRAEKALEAIYVCCFGNDPIDEEDERLLNVILNAVFPTVGEQQMEKIVEDKVKWVAEGGGDASFTAKALSKEAVEKQMKDLQFLKQNSAEILERKKES